MLQHLSDLVAEADRPIRTQYVALTAVSVIIKAVFIILLVPLLGQLFGQQPQEAARWLALFTIAWILSVVLDAQINRLGAELGFGLMSTVQRSVVSHLVQLPLGWFQSQTIGTARQSLATSGPELASLVMNVVTPLLNAVLLPAFIAIGLFTISPLLGGTAIAATALLWGALQLGTRLEKKSEQTFADANTLLNERVIEFARTQPVLRANHQTDPSLSAAGSALTGSYRALGKLLAWQIPSQLAFSVASQLALIGLAGATIWLAMMGDLSAPESIAVIVVIVRFLEPFAVLGELSVGITASRRTLGTLHDMLAIPPLTAIEREPSSGQTLPRYTGRTPPTIEFSGVSFAYPSASHNALSDVSFRAQSGTITAIVGPSGSGKSTVLSLMARFFDVSHGHITLDGTNIRTVHPLALLRYVSAIWQDVFLFDGTIRDNVVVGATHDEPVSDAELQRVAELSGVSEIVARLPNGWETRVGEGGSALSGGEKQRVSIARALLKAAPILLVDEATSALDNQNQNVVAAAIKSQAGARTVLVVAHQVSTIKDADHIVFIDQGRVIEQGTIDALIAQNGRFARYWEQRQASAHWQIK